MGKVKNSLASTAVTVIVLYVGVCIYFYAIQNNILFHPTSLEPDFTYGYTFEFEERWFDVTDEARIHAIHAKAQDSVNGLIFFIHGNGGNNNTLSERFTMFLDQGYDVLYPDYREYGKSTGELENEEDLVGDMMILYRQMAEEYDENNIVIIGYSLGSGVAALVAAENDPRELILWTPFYSMVDMKNASYPFLPAFALRYPLRTDLALPEIEEPITIFYAGEDEVLPLDRSIKLTKLLKPADRYFILENQGHNWLHENQQLRNKMDEILN